MLYVVPERMQPESKVEAQLRSYNTRIGRTQFRILRLKNKADSLEAIGFLSRISVGTLLIPDNLLEHDAEVDRVKNCAYLMDKKVLPVGRLIQKMNATPSALAGQPRLPVAEGVAL